MPFSPKHRIRNACLSSVLAVLAALAVMALPATALASGFTAHLHVPSHQPKVGKWPLRVTATRGSQKPSGSVSFRFLLDGTQVSKQPGHSFTRGVYYDTLIWPKRAVGHPITLQAVVRTRYGTDYLNWWIKVRA
jgi:hypothetical protein